MIAVLGKAETQEHNGDVPLFGELGNGADRSAFSDEDRLLSKSISDRLADGMRISVGH